jgi:hypothetical protein
MREPPGLGAVRLSADETLCWHLLEMNLKKLFQIPPVKRELERPPICI